MSEDKTLTEKGFIRLVKQLKLVSQEDINDMASKDDLKTFATKDDLRDFATKDDLKKPPSHKDLSKLESRLVRQIVDSNKVIISTVEKLHNEVVERIDELELNTVKRGEFEALKRKVDRHHLANY